MGTEMNARTVYKPRAAVGASWLDAVKLQKVSDGVPHAWKILLNSEGHHSPRGAVTRSCECAVLQVSLPSSFSWQVPD